MVSAGQPPRAEAPGTAERECGWTLGFRTGRHCTEIAPEDSWCTNHRRVDRRIEAKAKSFTAEAARLLDPAGPLRRKALRACGDPRKRAEKWWVASGVRIISHQLRNEILPDGRTSCVYCGARASEIDHIIPVTAGGLSVRENLAPACYPCNHEKGDLTPAGWREWRLAEGLCWPPKSFAELVDHAIVAIWDTGPGSFISDLAFKPTPLGQPIPSTEEDDERVQRASAALDEPRPDLSKAEAFLRRRAAGLLLEMSFDERHGCCTVCSWDLDEHDGGCPPEESAAATWVLELGEARTRFQDQLLTALVMALGAARPIASAPIQIEQEGPT